MNETKTERRSGKGLLIAQISVVLILVLVIVTYFALIADVQKEYAIFDGYQVTRLNADSTNIEEVLAEAGKQLVDDPSLLIKAREEFLEETGGRKYVCPIPAHIRPHKNIRELESF